MSLTVDVLETFSRRQAARAAVLAWWIRCIACLLLFAAILSWANPAHAQAPPSVTSLSPSKGPTTGGTVVTIMGSNIKDATAVWFGSVEATQFSIGALFIYATAPAGSGTVDVTVTTPGGTSDPSASTKYTYALPPTVSGLSPTSGPSPGGTVVTISGSNFTGATAVHFGGAPATNYRVDSPNQITATTPAFGGNGTIDVTVTTPGGTSTSNASTRYTYYLLPPTVSMLLPAAGAEAGGDRVILEGSNFTGAWAVEFGTTPAISYTIHNATQIAAIAPAGSGTVDVKVTTAGGTSVPNAATRYTYSPAPTVSGLSPTSGPSSGGTSVTLTGTDFTNVRAVKFGASNATSFTVNSATQITATAPAGSGTVDVTVTTTGGTSATGASTQYTYVPSPVVTALSPSTGKESGGTSVVITGSNFTGATAVKFGVSNATSFTVNSATQITATAPAGSGTVDVTVTTSNGTSGTSGSAQYTYAPPPTVSGLSPTSGPLAGGTSVMITGTGFTGDAIVKFGASNAASHVFNSPTSITAMAPAGSGTVDVTVTTAGGTSATGGASKYTYIVPPVISLEPASLPAGTVGADYATTISASGGVMPYTYSISGGALPPGMTLNAARGVLSGTPRAAGTVSFTLHARDADGFSGTHPYSLVIGAPTLALAPASLPAATAETAYSATLSA
ncbi:MAG: IPT/TIG domain-containing protein, partial [Burkholderiaceae bacterium]